jgi:hypothetical protein
MLPSRITITAAPGCMPIVKDENNLSTWPDFSIEDLVFVVCAFNIALKTRNAITAMGLNTFGRFLNTLKVLLIFNPCSP